MRYATVGIGVLLLLAFILCGCQRSRSVASVKTPKRVSVDKDFVASLKPTKDPRVLVVRIELVNPKVDKKIHQYHVVNVDFIFKDKSGRIVSRNEPSVRYAEEVGDVFYQPRKSASTTLEDKVRIITRNLPPGIYTVEPRVEIVEEGKDRVMGAYPVGMPRSDFGEVPIQAGNSLKIKIH